ncbi:MAG TPA: hypothetical protein DD491_06925 [Halieaceae bacterium]|nr:hypothetical protein [Halieaceae bacterium]
MGENREQITARYQVVRERGERLEDRLQGRPLAPDRAGLLLAATSGALELARVAAEVGTLEDLQEVDGYLSALERELDDADALL